MSAARRLLAWLWAAIWLRWRLVALRARRLLGAAPVAAAAEGPSFQLKPADVPVEGVDYDSDELPAELLARLEDTRGELRSHARLRAERGTGRVAVRWRRTVGVAAAALASLAVLGAGANALVSGSTGVPAVDRLLGIYEANLSKPGTEGRGGPSGMDIQPKPGSDSARLVVRLPEGRRLITASYVSVDGRICTALKASGEQQSGLTCQLSSKLLDQVEDRDGRVQITARRGDAIVLRGLVNGNVEDLEGSGPAGRLTMHVGRKWRPDVPGGVPLKPFVAVGPGAPDGDNDWRDYLISGVAGGGGRIQISP